MGKVLTSLFYRDMFQLLAVCRRLQLDKERFHDEPDC